MPDVNVPAPTDEERKLLRRMFHIERITDDEIVFINKARWWMNAVWTGALWLVCQGLTLILTFGMMSRQSCHSILCSPYVYVALVIAGLPIVAWAVRRADQARRSVVLIRGDAALTVRLGDREWRILLPGGHVPTEVCFSSANIPWRYLSKQTVKEQQTAATILARFTAAAENKRPEESWLFDLQAAGADVVGFDDESVSISGAGNVRSKYIGLGLASLGGSFLSAGIVGFFAVMADSISSLIGWGDIYTPLLSSMIPWFFFWLLSLPGPYILVREMTPFNVMTFWKGKNMVTLAAEGRGAPKTVHVLTEMIHQESLGAEPGGNVRVKGCAWGCMPEYGHGDTLVEYLREILKPERLRKPEFTL